MSAQPIQVDPAAIRGSLGLSQAEFANLLGISKFTVQKWEQGANGPSGAARALLQIAAAKPEVVREVLQVSPGDC